MADFKLSDSKVITGPPGPSLRTPSGVSAPRTSAGNLTIATGSMDTRYSPTQVPQALQDQVTPAMERFMGVTAQAAFEFEERESTYLAEQVVQRYEQDLANSYYGKPNPDGSFTPGYKSTTGATAVRSYGGYAGGAQEGFEKRLSGLAPRVQQKASIGMMNSKGAYLRKAASHKAEQMQAAIEEQRFLGVRGVKAQITSSRGDIHTPFPDGSTLKSQFFSYYDKPSEAKEEWSKTMQATVEQIYLDTVMAEGNEEAVQAAGIFFRDVARPELIDDQETTNKIVSKIIKWDQEATKTYNSTYTLELKKQEAAKKQVREDNANFFTSELYSGRPPAPVDVINSMQMGDLPRPVGTAILDAVQGKPVYRAPEIYRQHAIKQQDFDARNGFKDASGNSTRRNYTAHPIVGRDLELVQFLKQREDALSNKMSKAQIDSANLKLKSQLTTRFQFSGGLSDGQKLEIEALVQPRILQAVLVGKSQQEIQTEVLDPFFSDMEQASLPALSIVNKPLSAEEAAMSIRRLNQSLAARPPNAAEIKLEIKNLGVWFNNLRIKEKGRPQ